MPGGRDFHIVAVTFSISVFEERQLISFLRKKTVLFIPSTDNRWHLYPLREPSSEREAVNVPVEHHRRL